MKALPLFGTLVVAKLLAVAGRDLPLSAWTPLALLWQDALVALLFVAADFGLRWVFTITTRPLAPALSSEGGKGARRAGDRAVGAVVSWSLFWFIVAYTAMNVVLTRVLSSPLTWSMAHAAGGALMDSIRHYFTLANFALMATVALTAWGLVAVRLKVRPAWTRTAFAALAVLTMTGSFAAGKVDCGGLHRNALVALVDS